MSEYQYYEFLAVDRALDADQLDELRALSTRAHITPTSFVNTYHWGSFRGDPRRMVERYFDAFLYLANWGTRRLMIRLPAQLLDPVTAQRYCGTDSATAWAKDGNVIIELTRESDEGGWDEEDGEGRLASIVSARADLAAGDLLVGADGTSSAVRAQLLPDAVIDTLDWAIYGKTTLTAELMKATPNVLVDTFNRVIAPDGGAFAVATCRTTRAASGAAAELATGVGLTDIDGYLSWTISGAGTDPPRDPAEVHRIATGNP